MKTEKKSFDEWVKGKYSYDENMGWFNEETGDLISEEKLRNLHEEYLKSEDENVSEKTKQKKENIAEKENQSKEIQRITESEALKIINNHKGKGVVEPYEHLPKKGILIKKATLLDGQGKIKHQFTYAVSYNPGTHQK